jgi:hypothetical protein
MSRILILLILSCPAFAQSPPSIEKLVDDLAALRAQRLDLEKKEAEKSAELKSRLAELQRRIDDLVGPVKPDTNAEFLSAVKAALAKESDADKLLLPKLISLYRAASQTVSAATTWGALWQAMASTATQLGIAGGKLPNVQAAVSKELIARLPINPREKPAETLTADHAKLLASEFARVVTVLEQVK